MTTASVLSSVDTDVEVVSAVDALLTPLAGRWPHRFVLRGREYVMAGGTFRSDAGGASFRVFPVGKPAQDLRVRDADSVEILSHVGTWAPNEEVFVS